MSDVTCFETFDLLTFNINTFVLGTVPAQANCLEYFFSFSGNI